MIGRRWFLAVLVAVAAGLAVPALAQPGLGEAKQAGLVGERPDGLLGVVAPAPGVDDLVRRINAERLREYQGIARNSGTTADKVQALAGRKIIDRTPPGQFIMTPSGQWVRK